jgi:hypothetical protein
VGIKIAGNDHYVTNVIVYSSRVGIELTGAANIVNGIHTWNQATGNGGIGILNRESQNRFTGCYLDFNDLVLENAQQVTVSDGFFLGGGQLVFAAPAAGSAIVATTITGTVWRHTSLPALAVNETAGTWTSALDLLVTGSTQPGAPRGVTVATKVLTVPLASWPADGVFTVDFSDVLLLPHAPIQAATARWVGGPLGSAHAAVPYPLVGALPAKAAGSPLAVTVYASPPPAGAGPGSLQLLVTADQSASSSVSAAS